MPLSKERMKERKRCDRAVKPTSLVSNLVKPKSKEERLELAHQALADVVKPKLDPIQSTRSPVKESVRPIVPLYSKTSKPGDLVRKWVGGRYVEVEVKEVDAEGNAVPEYY